MFNILAITNRHICTDDFFTQLEKICSANLKISSLKKSSSMLSSLKIVLREKDLCETDYKKIAEKVFKICKIHNTDCILHTYYNAAKELNCDNIHLPFNIFKNHPNISNKFKCVGVSIHSIDEAIEAEELGAGYIIAGHIFPTDCKKDLPPRGLSFLSSVCSSVNIPVYAIGGISPSNAQSVLNAGAYGICLMSSLMKCKNPNEYLNSFSDLF